MQTSHIRNCQTAGRNLFKNGQILIIRPDPPPLAARQNLNPPHRLPALQNQ
jgi:hypothetical protein